MTLRANLNVNPVRNAAIRPATGRRQSAGEHGTF
jgi:hypothetical protein